MRDNSYIDNQAAETFSICKQCRHLTPAKITGYMVDSEGDECNRTRLAPGQAPSLRNQLVSVPLFFDIVVLAKMNKN